MELGIVSWNIQRSLHRDAIAGLFATSPELQAAHVIAVQEAAITEAFDARSDLVAALAGGHAAAYAPVMRYPGKEYGNLVLARPPLTVVRQEAIDLPRLDRLRFHERLKTEGGRPDTKTTLAVHLADPERSILVINAHLDFAGGAAHRARQLGRVLEWLERYASNARFAPPLVATILCGDLNTIGWYRTPGAARATARALAPAFAAGFTDCTTAIPWTSDLFSSIDPADPAARLLRAGRALRLHWRQKTDHILARGSLRVGQAGVVPHGPEPRHGMSDHLPIFAMLRPES